MTTKLITILVTAFVLTGLGFIGGCANSAQSGAGIGAIGGAIAGQLIGGDTKGTLIGAGVGTGAGYIIGNEMDKKKSAKEMEALKSQSAAQQNTVTVWITNSNGSQRSVILTKSGPGYYGPRGEYYPQLPTSEQLRPVYGF